MSVCARLLGLNATFLIFSATYLIGILGLCNRLTFKVKWEIFPSQYWDGKNKICLLVCNDTCNFGHFTVSVVNRM